MIAPAIVMMIAALSAGTVQYAPPLEGRAERGPSVVEVQQKAIEHARLDPSEISQWKKKAKLSALLPRLQVDYSRRVWNEVNVNINESVYVGSSGTNVGPDQGGYSENLNADNNIGFKAIWSLPDTIFSTDLLAVSEESRLLARERQALLAEVNKNFFQRERAIREMALIEEELKDHGDKDRTRHELMAKGIAKEEATAALDALTGGWFSEQTVIPAVVSGNPAKGNTRLDPRLKHSGMTNW